MTRKRRPHSDLIEQEIERVLNPSDNQGVRFLIDDVRARTVWEDREAE
jgi:hypothetical protein